MGNLVGGRWRCSSVAGCVRMDVVTHAGTMQSEPEWEIIKQGESTWWHGNHAVGYSSRVHAVVEVILEHDPRLAGRRDGWGPRELSGSLAQRRCSGTSGCRFQSSAT